MWNKRIIVLGLLLVASGMASPANQSGIYVGAGAGSVTGDRHGDRELPTREGAAIDQRDVAWTIYGGYRFSGNYLAVELGYWDLGTFTWPGNAGCAYARDESIRDYYLRANGRLPLFARLYLTAHVGAARSNYGLREYPSSYVVPRAQLHTGSAEFSQPEDETALLWGAGAEWDFNEHLSARAEWSRHDLDNPAFGVSTGPTHELATYSLALQWRF